MTAIRRYCACGGALYARSTPNTTAEAIADKFDRFHRAAGCEPTTAAGAADARRREDARLAAEAEEANA